jgi:heat shock protein HslJ
MKKYAIILAMALPLCACGNEEAPSLRGGEYETTVEGTVISLNFAADEDRISGKVVNRYNGPYEANGNQIRFGIIAATRMLAVGDAQRVEDEYFRFLVDVNSYKISGNELLLKASDGKKMNFKKIN